MECGGWVGEGGVFRCRVRCLDGEGGLYRDARPCGLCPQLPTNNNHSLPVLPTPHSPLHPTVPYNARRVVGPGSILSSVRGTLIAGLAPRTRLPLLIVVTCWLLARRMPLSLQAPHRPATPIGVRHMSSSMHGLRRGQARDRFLV